MFVFRLSEKFEQMSLIHCNYPREKERFNLLCRLALRDIFRWLHRIVHKFQTLHPHLHYLRPLVRMEVPDINIILKHDWCDFDWCAGSVL